MHNQENAEDTLKKGIKGNGPDYVHAHITPPAKPIKIIFVAVLWLMAYGLSDGCNLDTTDC